MRISDWSSDVCSSNLIADQWLDHAILTKMDTGGIVDRHGRVVAIPYLRQQDPSPGGHTSTLLSLTGLNASRRPAFRNIELEMVINGWAWVLDRYGPNERYSLALADAQRNRRGIWAKDDKDRKSKRLNSRHSCAPRL